jgi:hypothetical protein
VPMAEPAIPASPPVPVSASIPLEGEASPSRVPDPVTPEPMIADVTPITVQPAETPSPAVSTHEEVPSPSQTPEGSSDAPNSVLPAP